eukprot:403358376
MTTFYCKSTLLSNFNNYSSDSESYNQDSWVSLERFEQENIDVDSFFYIKPQSPSTALEMSPSNSSLLKINNEYTKKMKSKNLIWEDAENLSKKSDDQNFSHLCTDFDDYSPFEQSREFQFYSELLNSKKNSGKRMKTPLQNKILESEYLKDPTLWSKAKISQLSKVLGLTASQVYKWNWDLKMHEEQSFKRRIKQSKNYYGQVFKTQKEQEEDQSNGIFKINK